MTTPADHLRQWFTPLRRRVISSRALDAEVGRPLGTFSRFLAGQKGFTMLRSDLGAYVRVLEQFGYVPPSE